MAAARSACGSFRVGRSLNGLHFDSKARFHRIASRLHDFALAAGYRDLRAFAGQQHRRALAHRTRACEHDRALAAQAAAVGQPRNRRGSRGIRAIAVEHDRDAKFGEEFCQGRRQHRFALRQIGAADEDRGVFLVLRRARKDRPLHQPAHIAGVHAAIGRNVVRTAVVADDVVKYRRVGVGIELV